MEEETVQKLTELFKNGFILEDEFNSRLANIKEGISSLFFYKLFCFQMDLFWKMNARSKRIII